MNNFDFLKAITGTQIAGALLAIAFLLFYIAFIKKPNKGNKK